MNPPSVEELSAAYYARSLEEQTITSFDEFYGLETRERVDDETIKSWSEDAEELNQIPRTAYIVDYWNPPGIIREHLEEVSNTELDLPGLEGVKFAQNLIEAGRMKDSASYGYIVEVTPIEQDSEINPNMAGSPAEIYRNIPIPEEYQQDDIFTAFENKEKVGILTDDPTVIARQGLETAEWMNRQPESSLPFEYLKAMEETIESYRDFNP